MKRKRIAMLVSFISLSIGLFNTKVLGQSLNSGPVNIQHLVLTGQTEAEAKHQIYCFAMHKDEDNRPDIVSVWFDSTTVHRIVKLLHSEGADGIRIYYTADSTNAPYLKASIVLVSTKSDLDIQYPDQSTHRDYYEHNANDDLFKKPDAIRGEVRNDGCDGGALFYTRSVKTNTPSDPSNSNDVPILTGENMVIRNKNHKHQINTISEWLPYGVFYNYAQDKNSDGVRIYFARRRGYLGIFTTGRNSFLLINTKGDSTSGKTIHKDDIDPSSSILSIYGYVYSKGKALPFVDPKTDKPRADPTDNGQLCPYNCN
ncbi:MAG: hypothetical protein ACXVA2_22510 [Mucilaginibacter sp.]